MAYVHTIRKTTKSIRSYCEKRDVQIYAYSQKGWTQAELAEKYHVTTQRVGQIIAAQARAARRTGKQKKAS